MNENVEDTPDEDSLAEPPTSLDELHDGEDPVEVARDYVQGVLLGRIADPVERWEAVSRLSDELPATLERVRALSVAQLVQSGMSVEEAGEAVGVNRQRAHALLTGHDQPTPRQLKANPVQQQPGHRLGVYFGVASVIADTLDRLTKSGQTRDQLDKLMNTAHAAPAAIVGRVATEIARWTRRTRREYRMKLLLTELEQAAAQLGDLPQFLGPVQQSHMWVARSTTRIRLASAH